MVSPLLIHCSPSLWELLRVGRRVSDPTRPFYLHRLPRTLPICLVSCQSAGEAKLDLPYRTPIRSVSKRQPASVNDCTEVSLRRASYMFGRFDGLENLSRGRVPRKPSPESATTVRGHDGHHEGPHGRCPRPLRAPRGLNLSGSWACSVRSGDGPSSYSKAVGA